MKLSGNTIKTYVKLAGVPKNLDSLVFGRQLEYGRTIKAFCETAKVAYVSSKHRSYTAAFREFLDLYKPTQYYCRTIQGPTYKDDSIQVFYTSEVS